MDEGQVSMDFHYNAVCEACRCHLVFQPYKICVGAGAMAIPKDELAVDSAFIP
jgi:hypothetical protein